jgi:hypothetical protein
VEASQGARGGGGGGGYEEVEEDEVEQLTHGQCEYMSPLTFRRIAESIIDRFMEQRTSISLGALLETDTAFCINWMWNCERLGLPLLLDGMSRSEVVHCSWMAPRLSDVSWLRETVKSKLRIKGLRSVAPPHGASLSTAVRRKQLQKFDTDSAHEPASAKMYVVSDLMSFDPFENNSLWGNETVARLVGDSELTRVPIQERSYVTMSSTPINVVRKLVKYMADIKFAKAVQLFLSARMASRVDEESDQHIEYGTYFVTRGWEVFSNSVYIEFYALCNMAPSLQATLSKVDLDLERHLRKILTDLEKVDPTLASYLEPSDYPPAMNALAFRTYFDILYP